MQTSTKWENVKLGDVADVTSSKRIFASDYVPDGIAFYRSREVIEKNKGNNISTELYISKEKFESIKKKFGAPKKNDLLITSVGTLGVPYLVKENETFYFKDGNLIWFRHFDESKVVPQFVYYSIVSPDTQKRLKGISIGSSQGAFTISAIKEFVISFPDLSNQKQIVDVLSAYDDLIDNNKRRIKILEETAQKIYTEWFVNFKFPEHEKVKMVDSGTEFGMIPEGWEVKRLDTVAKINSENIKSGKNSEIISYVDIAAVSTGKIDSVLVTNFMDAPSRARRILRHGDIVWSTVRPNRKSYSLVINPPENLVGSTGLAVLRATTVPSSYLYQFVTSENFVSYLVSRAQGAAYPAVRGDDFGNAQILIPTSKLTEMLDALCEPIIIQISTLQKQNRILGETRDLLIPKLLTGKRELKST